MQKHCGDRTGSSDGQKRIPTEGGRCGAGRGDEARLGHTDDGAGGKTWRKGSGT